MQTYPAPAAYALQPQAVSMDVAVDQAFNLFLQRNGVNMTPQIVAYLQNCWANAARQQTITNLTDYQRRGGQLNTQTVYDTVRNWAGTVINAFKAQAGYGAPVVQAGYPQPGYGVQGVYGTYQQPASGGSGAALGNLGVNQAQLQQQAAAQSQPVAPQPAPVAIQPAQPVQNLQPAPQVNPEPQGDVYMFEKNTFQDVEAPFATGAVHICENQKSKYNFTLMDADITASWSNIFGMASELIRYFQHQDFVADVTFTHRMYCGGVKIEDAKSFVGLLKDTVAEFHQKSQSITTLIENIQSICSMVTNKVLVERFWTIIESYIHKIVDAGIFAIDDILAYKKDVARKSASCPIKDFKSLVENRPGMDAFKINKFDQIPRFTELWNAIFNYAVVNVIDHLNVMDTANLREVADVFKYVSLNGAESGNHVLGFRIFSDVDTNADECRRVAENNAILTVTGNPAVIFNVIGTDVCFNEDVLFEFADEPYSCEYEYAINRTLRNRKLDSVIDIIVINKAAVAHIHGLAVVPGEKIYFSKAK